MTYLLRLHQINTARMYNIENLLEITKKYSISEICKKTTFYNEEEVFISTRDFISHPLFNKGLWNKQIVVVTVHLTTTILICANLAYW
ncbi:hypothetical protein UM89_12385 [Bacillus subtilis]|nr:hypothetical protein UM89_12385 [Bacillus subtilis]